ncbi:MAG: LysM peptidoglycan-binding domain-containing protein [Anaerolineaceae bacterium]|nr:LysM peptidoglycan-binding domain-containing protein [Anaerolineaceae bacterium]
MTINTDYTCLNTANTGNRGRKGVVSDYRYIVVHYVGNCNKNGTETTAKANCIYYRDEVAKASANYFVDKTGAYMSVPWNSDRYAWHCGAGSGQYLIKDNGVVCQNSTALGVEICVCKVNPKTKNASDKDWYFDPETYKNAVALVKQLMKQFRIKADQVVRHYDVNTIHKLCPRPMVGDDINTYYGETGNAMWKRFKAEIGEDEEPNPAVTEYVVRKGDYLGKIANMFDVTVNAIAILNGISDVNLIYVGQILKIPVKEPPEVYVVKKGDTLSAIAKKYKTTVAKLVKANGIKDKNLINIGQKIIIVR